MDSQYRRICEHLRPMAQGRELLTNMFNGVVAVTLGRSRSSSPDGRERILGSDALSESQQGAARYALTLSDEGRFQAAGEAYSTLLQNLSTIQDKDLTIRLFTCNKLSTAFRECGRYEDTKSICETIIGKKNPNRLTDSTTWKSVQTITTSVRNRGAQYHKIAAAQLVGNLALTMRDQGFESAEAIAMISSVLEDSDGALINLPLRISLTSILSKLYRDVGNFSLSELLAREVLLCSIREFGPESPFTLCRGSDLAALLCKRGKLSLAAEFCVKALNLLEKSLGSYHQDSLKASQRLAYIKLFQGSYDEACTRFQDVLLWQLKRLNSQHRHVLSSMSGIGVCYLFQGRLEKGEQFLRRAKTGQIGLLGNFHPDTQWTSNFLQKLEETKAGHLNEASEKTGTPKSRAAVVLGRTAEEPHGEAATLSPESSASYERFEEALMEALKALLQGFLQYSDRQTSLYGPTPFSLSTAENAEKGTLNRELRMAAATGNEERIVELLDRGADPNDVGGFYGSSLHAASFGGSPAIVEKLLRSHAKVNIESGIFGTALRAAAFRGHEKVVLQLLDAGANRNGCESPERSPLRAAMSMGHHRIVAELVRRGADKYTCDDLYGTPLHEAAMSGQDKMVEILLDEDTNPDIRAGIFKTAIEASAWAGNAVTTEILIRRGSSLDPRFEGKRALDIAKSRGHKEVLRLLKQRLENHAPDYLKPSDRKRERGASSASASALRKPKTPETPLETKEGKPKPNPSDSKQLVDLIKKRVVLRSIFANPSRTGALFRERRTQKGRGLRRGAH